MGSVSRWIILHPETPSDLRRTVELREPQSPEVIPPQIANAMTSGQCRLHLTVVMAFRCSDHPILRNTGITVETHPCGPWGASCSILSNRTTGNCDSPSKTKTDRFLPYNRVSIFVIRPPYRRGIRSAPWRPSSPTRTPTALIYTTV